MIQTERFALGIDLGGTNIKAILVDSQGHELGWNSRKTETWEGRPSAVLDRMADSAKQVLQISRKMPGDILGMGIGFPGPLDRREKRIIWPTNLVGWRDVDLAGEMQSRLAIPCILENDANAAAYAEAWQGQGRGKQDLIILTLGTGVGGGIILGGRVWRGHQDTAGEIGHQCLDPQGPLCGCGQKGCLEAYASAPAIIRNAEAAMRNNKLEKIGDMTIDNLTAKGLADCALAGDALAQELFLTAGHYLGQGIANLINVLNPELVILAGGLAQAGDLILNPVREIVQMRALDPRAKNTPILLTKLGEKAGALGAAGIVFDSKPTE